MRSISVLIVDDQADIRLLLRALIDAANEGLIVDNEVASGEEALSYLETGDATVVLLDHMMPGLTGIDTARELLSRNPAQRIVLFSAYLDSKVREEASELGIAKCVDKGDFEQVATALREVAG